MSSWDTAETWSANAELSPDCRATLRPETLLSHVHSAGVADLGDLPTLIRGRELGRGGMGVVELAEQGRLGREVAVKRLRDDGPPGADRELLKEAWVTGALEHPNIVPIHDVLLDEHGRPQIVLKRIEGVSWQEVLDDPSLIPGTDPDPLEFHFDVLIQVCRALEFSHQRGIIHRDLKPDNVMVGLFGEVYLMDWGIAVSLVADAAGRLPTLATQRGLVGTPLYMAPEMFFKDLAKLGSHTDIYLLAGMLFRVLAGRPPREPGTLQDICRQAMKPPVLDYSWPEDLRDLLTRAFARDVGRRPDATAFRESLRAHLSRRETRRLLKRVVERAPELEELIASADGADDEELHRQIHDVFGGIRFGMQEVLERWPEDEAALEVHERVFEAMLRYELGQGDARSARVLLDQLRNPPEALAAEVTTLVGESERARQRLARLDQQLNLASGFRARVAILLVLGGIWLGFPLLASLLGFPRTYGRGVFMNLVTFTITAVGGLVFFRSMLRSQANRGFLALAILSPALGMLQLGVAWHWGMDVVEERVLRGFLDAHLVVVGALLVDRRLFPAAVAYLGAAVLSVVLPTLTGLLLMSATLFLVVNGAVVWTMGRRGRADVPRL